MNDKTIKLYWINTENVIVPQPPFHNKNEIPKDCRNRWIVFLKASDNKSIDYSLSFQCRHWLNSITKNEWNTWKNSERTNNGWIVAWAYADEIPDDWKGKKVQLTTI